MRTEEEIRQRFRELKKTLHELGIQNEDFSQEDRERAERLFEPMIARLDEVKWVLNEEE